MTYSTLIAAQSGGLLDEAGARRFAFLAARATVARFGPAAAAAFVGLVGSGIFGDERGYAEPGALARDAAAFRAAGVGALVAFSLEGVLAQREPEQVAPGSIRLLEQPQER